MAPAVIAALVGAGSSLLDSLFGHFNNNSNANVQRDINNQNIQFQNQVNQQNFDFQREMSQSNFENQVKMWNMANDYNHPAQQMARYRQAGLNPNLIYGHDNTGSTPSVTTAQSANAKAPQINPYFRNPVAVGDVASQFISVLSQLEDLHMKKRENEIQQSVKDQILLKYKFENDYIESLVNKLDTESSNISQQTKNLITKNLLDSFDLSQTSTISKMNQYRLGMMANDFEMKDVYNEILENQRDLSKWDVKNATWDYMSVRPMKYNLMSQELNNMKQQQKLLKEQGVLIQNQAKKVANDDKWYWRLSHDLSHMLGDVVEMYLQPKMTKSFRAQKWGRIEPNYKSFSF